METVRDFLSDINNRTKIRYIGFSMGVVVMLIGIAAAIVAGVAGNAILGGIAAVTILSGFVTFPATDLNYPRQRSYY